MQFNILVVSLIFRLGISASEEHCNFLEYKTNESRFFMEICDTTAQLSLIHQEITLLIEDSRLELGWGDTYP